MPVQPFGFFLARERLQRGSIMKSVIEASIPVDSVAAAPLVTSAGYGLYTVYCTWFPYGFA